MSLFQELQEHPGWHSKKYHPGDLIMNAGDMAESFIILEYGEIKQCLPEENYLTRKMGAESVDFFSRSYGPGDCIDAECFFAGRERYYDTCAVTEVCVYTISKAYWDEYYGKSKNQETLLHYAINDISCRQLKFERSRAKTCLSMVDSSGIDDLISRASRAQEKIQGYSDRGLELLVEDVISVIEENRLSLAFYEIQALGVGNISDKDHMLGEVCRNASSTLLGITTKGKLSMNEAGTLVDYASPVGVIVSFFSNRNLIPQLLLHTLYAVRTGNVLIVSFPADVDILGGVLVSIIHAVLRKHDLFSDVIQVMPQPLTQLNIHSIASHPGVDCIFSTEDFRLTNTMHDTNSSHSRLNNTPVIITEDADIALSAELLVLSKSYDNGIVYGSESNIVVDEVIYNDFLKALEAQGAAVLSADELVRIEKTCFNGERQLFKSVIGKTAIDIACKSGITRDFPIKLLVLPATLQNKWLGNEKRAPLLAIFKVPADKMIEEAKQLFSSLGSTTGTASIFSHDHMLIDEFAREIPAGRLLVNTSTTFGVMGMTTDLPLTFTLRRNNWGGGAARSAVPWHDFVNIKRLAHFTRDLEMRA